MKNASKHEPLCKGTTVMESMPFVYCLKSSFRGQLCDFCLKANSSLRKCCGCMIVSYCGRVCQREGWKDHKMECKNLLKVKPNIPTDSVRLMARLIIKLQRGGDMESEHITTVWSRKFKDLLSHRKEIKEDVKRMEYFLTICGVLNEYLSDEILPNAVELLGIYGRMCVNSFNIMNGEMQAIGTGIYLAPSILDHSCSPNAVVTFDGFKLSVRLTQDLPKLDWNCIHISYIDLMNSKNHRKKELKERYYFDCDCPRCRCGKIDCYHYAARCPSCRSPIAVKRGEEFPPCSCGFLLDSSCSKQFWSAADFSEQQLLLMQDTNYLDVCKLCLTKQEDSFHDLCLIRSKVLDAAFDSAVQLQLWESAIQYGFPLVHAYKHWYGNEHPLTAILLLKIFKILLLVSPNDDSVALKYYQEAAKIIELTHGKASMFYQQDVKSLIRDVK
ncbi:histone-lysine N-methyltransferase SMYD3-like [Daphnia carinata]|uniref:histone-lysine N-methyltransferase SMYD3-like n=1 Tax=Daphnia carinata TaxID=120202 RepID=UPI00258053D9|nr:histone-lysine N-methyltransferase SMYD3-like [Daphnia carinata]